MEDVEREKALQQVELLEGKLRDRMTDAQSFAVTVIQLMCDIPMRKLADEEGGDAVEDVLKKRRQSATLSKFRDDVTALEWATQQFDEYENDETGNNNLD